MTKEKYNRFGFEYFWNAFQKKKRKYPKSYFFGLKSRKQTLPVERSLYKKIIATYFQLYFNDFYTRMEPMYFPLSGELTKSKGKSFFKHKIQRYSRPQTSINWIWYLRPKLNWMANMAIIKLKGSTSRIGALEKTMKESFDLSLFPDLKTTLQTLKLYK